MSLWWLGDPSKPVKIGSLHLAMMGRGVSLFYDDTWIKHGFALSEVSSPMRSVEVNTTGVYIPLTTTLELPKDWNPPAWFPGVAVFQGSCFKSNKS